MCGTDLRRSPHILNFCYIDIEFLLHIYIYICIEFLQENYIFTALSHNVFPMVGMARAGWDTTLMSAWVQTVVKQVNPFGSENMCTCKMQLKGAFWKGKHICLKKCAPTLSLRWITHYESCRGADTTFKILIHLHCCKTSNFLWCLLAQVAPRKSTRSTLPPLNLIL